MIRTQKLSDGKLTRQTARLTVLNAWVLHFYI